jgi:hypothetical protein
MYKRRREMGCKKEREGERERETEGGRTMLLLISSVPLVFSHEKMRPGGKAGHPKRE